MRTYVRTLVYQQSVRIFVVKKNFLRPNFSYKTSPMTILQLSSSLKIKVPNDPTLPPVLTWASLPYNTSYTTISGKVLKWGASLQAARDTLLRGTTRAANSNNYFATSTVHTYVHINMYVRMSFEMHTSRWFSSRAGAVRWGVTVIFLSRRNCLETTRLKARVGLTKFIPERPLNHFARQIGLGQLKLIFKNGEETQRATGWRAQVQIKSGRRLSEAY
jgi:hypothetical protein